MPRNTETTPTTPEVVETPTPETTTPTAAPTRTRRSPKPATTRTRTLEELQNVDPKKMTDAEKIITILDARETVNLAVNKVEALTDVCNSLAKQKQEAEKAYEYLRIKVSENQNYVEATVRQFANTMLLLGKVK